MPNRNAKPKTREPVSDSSMVPSAEANETFLSSSQLKNRYGNLSNTALFRWLERDFPQPIFIHGRRYWRLSDLITYERASVRRKIEMPAEANAIRQRGDKKAATAGA